MTDDSFLFRQVHPSWIQGNRVTSQAFRPTPKDAGCLSTYDGDKIAANKSWEHYTVTLKLASTGVVSLQIGECVAESLSISATPEVFPEHVCVQFDGLSKPDIERKSKKLQVAAAARGWAFQPNNDVAPQVLENQSVA